jgi:hypothetical protein
MLLVVASESDETARALASRWSLKREVRRLTPRDLSRRGWASTLHFDGVAVAASSKMSEQAFVAGGERLLERDIEGVFTRLSAVTPVELPHVASAERPYVAAEMTAFLGVWLANLTCPVVNRPHVLGLSGPAFARAQWLGLAAERGIAVSARNLQIPSANPDLRAGGAVVVVGDRCFGAVSAAVEASALELARATGAEVLGLSFDAAGGLIDQLRFPDLATSEIADAVLARFEVGA